MQVLRLFAQDVRIAASLALPKAGRSNPALEARDSSGEEPPHVQGVVAARAQEGLEELSHVEGQEGQR